MSLYISHTNALKGSKNNEHDRACTESNGDAEDSNHDETCTEGRFWIVDIRNASRDEHERGEGEGVRGKHPLN